MGATEYTYAVARIRANELSLLTAVDMEQIINSDSVESAKRILSDKGWNVDAQGDLCENEMQKAYNLIAESVPDKTILDALTAENDFFNLKAAIKSVFSGAKAEDYMVLPSSVPPENIIEAVNTKDFSILPEFMRDCALKAYNAVSESGSGQKSEIIIDRCFLDTFCDFAEKSGSDILLKIAELNCVVSNVKIAVRCKKTGKTKEFALDAFTTGCKALDNNQLLEAAYSDGELAPIVSKAGFSEIAEYADKDFASLEKAGDNLVVSLIKKAKYDIFGLNPVVAYYYAKNTETKNVRIILSSKESGVPKEAISERVRELYV